MPYFNTLQYDVVIERIEREQPDKEGHRLKSLVETFFLQKIMSVWDKDHVSCGKNHVSLWEKFVGQKTSLENTCTSTKKHTGLFTSICLGTRLTTMENS